MGTLEFIKHPLLLLVENNGVQEAWIASDMQWAALSDAGMALLPIKCIAVQHVLFAGLPRHMSTSDVAARCRMLQPLVLQGCLPRQRSGSSNTFCKDECTQLGSNSTTVWGK